MTSPKFAQGGEASLPVIFREFTGGPYIDPSDARFDVLDPSSVIQESDVATTIVIVPGRHKGVWPIPGAAAVGVWTMRFQATINGSAVKQDCDFEVVPAGSIEPGTGTGDGPCEPWPFDATCCDLPEGATDALIVRKSNEATRILWAASGRVYGPCPVTVRPCLRSCAGSVFVIGAHLSPYIGHDGLWRNASCGCSGDCSCGELCEVVLEGPVHEIIEVLADEEFGGDPVTRVVPPESYRLDKVGSQMRLVRTGEGCWPSCQDQDANCDEEGSFCVTYYQGLPIDELAQAAMNQLTCELVKSCIPGCACLLPKNVVTSNRRGTAQTFDTSKGWLRTLPMVDAFLDAVNPNGLPRPLRVSSPDSRGPRFVR